ncbi:hypothetical protein [Phenylobacterium sp.]|nr:hypothetical protein [Phenylobacterium sp.]MBX3483751.1 hypothetical protein [Phenylobacterium sp.]MCW5759777.1 hypothetical protein [Phenylobacterium sp.]
MDGTVLLGAMLVPKWMVLLGLAAAFPTWLGLLFLLTPQQRVPVTAKPHN